MNELNPGNVYAKYMHLMRITQKEEQEVDFVGFFGMEHNSLVGFAYESVRTDSGLALRLVQKDGSLLVLDPKKVRYELIEDYVLPYKASSLKGLQSSRALSLSLPAISRRSLPDIESAMKRKISERKSEWQESMKVPHIRYLVVSLRPEHCGEQHKISIHYNKLVLDENSEKVLYLKFK